MHPFFDKVTDRARAALDISNTYAQKNKDKLVTPLHILYGILEENKNVAVVVLKNLGVNTSALKNKVLETLGNGSYNSNDIGVPYSLDVCRLMCIAIDYGIQIKHIACQHLLKAMLMNPDDLVYVLLTKEGINLELVDAEIKSSVKSNI